MMRYRWDSGVPKPYRHLKNPALPFRRARAERAKPLVKTNGRCVAALSPILTVESVRWP
jgi:hypothetical protein